MEFNNGYDLLWHVMALTVPGFDPVIPVCIPVWRDNDIFKFASSFLLCYHLHVKKGIYHDDCTRSLTFLQAITEPAYTDGVTSLLTCVCNYYYYATEDDGYLPSHLCIIGLATQIHKSVRHQQFPLLTRQRVRHHLRTPSTTRTPILPGRRECTTKVDRTKDATSAAVTMTHADKIARRPRVTCHSCSSPRLA
jgi:hypothetical protein